MMPQTVPDGFEFEQFPGDEPGRTLHGGHAGDSPILAEQVQAKFIDVDAQLAAYEARIAAIENGTGGVGWIPITSGSSSGSSFTVDLTDGGRFPSPPLWSEVRVSMKIDLSAAAYVNARVNGDNDLGVGYRSGSFTMDSVVPANSEDENWHFPSGNQGAWVIGRCATISTNVIDFRVYHADSNPGLLSFQSIFNRQSDDPQVHRAGVAWGAITASRTLTSLVFLPSSPVTIVNAYWKAEGLRLVPPS